METSVATVGTIEAKRNDDGASIGDAGSFQEDERVTGKESRRTETICQWR